MIYDTLENWNFYFNTGLWEKAFEFLLSLKSDADENTYIELDGENMYAAIMTYNTCEPQDSVLESHDIYIDIQASLKNSEAIDCYRRSNLRVKHEYDTQKDRTLYHRPGSALARVNNYPGFFTVLFPHDAHMPKLMTGSEPAPVKKVVVKLSIKALRNV